MQQKPFASLGLGPSAGVTGAMINNNKSVSRKFTVVARDGRFITRKGKRLCGTFEQAYAYIQKMHSKGCKLQLTVRLAA